jgi:hypothetical protein
MVSVITLCGLINTRQTFKFIPMENETNEEGHDEDIETNDDGSVTTYDEDYIQSLESKNYSVSLPCLRERVVVMHKITSKRDLDALEKSVRVMLKCDFGACLALETASYSRMRSKMLRLLRTNSPTLEFQTPERIYIAQNFILEFVWDEFKISIVEKPQQQKIESEHEIRFFFIWHFNCNAMGDVMCVEPQDQLWQTPTGD